MSSQNNQTTLSVNSTDKAGWTGRHKNLILSDPFTDYETLPRIGAKGAKAKKPKANSAATNKVGNPATNLTPNGTHGKPGNHHAGSHQAGNHQAGNEAGNKGNLEASESPNSTAAQPHPQGAYKRASVQHIKDAIYSNVDPNPLHKRQSLRRAVLRDPKSNGFHMLGLVDDKNPFINLARRYAEQTRKGDRVTESVFSLEKLKQRNLLGMTPLEWALRHGTPRTAEGFIRLIAAFHQPSDLELKEENLFRLARRNSPEMVELLIRLRHLLGLFDQNFEDVYSEPRALLSDPLQDEIYAA